jgi:formyltetrahydrofolate deformylase
MTRARLLLSCADAAGIIARVTTYLAGRGANVIDADQHSSVDRRFFMRLVLEHDADPAALAAGFAAEVAEPLAMSYRFAAAGEPKSVALLCSREDHCLLDLLWRIRRGELEARCEAVVSTYPDHATVVEGFEVPYHHVPVSDGNAAAEARALELLRGEVDLIVLARYMQILSADFLDRVGCPLINIHHGFLPAFAGADPYQRAYDRGVKLIGATAHYVTEELDAGPIIEQDVIAISHHHEPDDLATLGRDIERVVLARAVKAHLEDRVLLDGQRTIVFRD